MLNTLNRSDPVAPYGPLARCVKWRVAHAPGMPGTFSPPPRVRDPNMHHGTCVTHVPWCMLGSLISGFPWSWRLEKRSRHSRRMCNPRFYVSGKISMATWIWAKIGPDSVACCPTASSHYLNQSSPIIKDVLWHTPGNYITIRSHELNP